MLSYASSETNTTIRLLKLLNIKVAHSSVNETLQAHPAYPSLLSISDALFKWNIPNGAGKIETTEIDQLPTPFIAALKDPIPYVVVTRISDNVITYQEPSKSGDVQQPRAEFLARWNGVYLIVEPNEDSGQPDFNKKRRQEIAGFLFPVLSMCLFVCICFFSVNYFIAHEGILNDKQTFGTKVLLLLHAMGFIITALLLWYEIDRSNPALNKACTAIKNTSCGAVLGSKQARIFKQVTWSEIGFVYYLGGLLYLLFGKPTNYSVTVLAWLQVLALPYTLYSIYFQWRVIKQWCTLCLGVQVLLIAGFINVANNQLLTLPAAPAAGHIITFLLCYLSVILAWTTAKPVFAKAQLEKETSRQLKRLKYNEDLFTALLKAQKSVSIPSDGLGITLGNRNATNTIIKVCNPYCGPCARAHVELHQLMKENKDLKVQIIFTATAEKNDKRAQPVKHLLAIAGKKNEVQTEQALDDWYLAKEKQYEIFSAKYAMNGEVEQQTEKIMAMEKWCREMEIRYTPTLFINGYELPDAYGIEDVKYFLSV